MFITFIFFSCNKRPFGYFSINALIYSKLNSINQVELFIIISNHQCKKSYYQVFKCYKCVKMYNLNDK